MKMRDNTTNRAINCINFISRILTKPFCWFASFPSCVVCTHISSRRERIKSVSCRFLTYSLNCLQLLWLKLLLAQLFWMTILLRFVKSLINYQKVSEILKQMLEQTLKMLSKTIFWEESELKDEIWIANSRICLCKGPSLKTMLEKNMKMMQTIRTKKKNHERITTSWHKYLILDTYGKS